MGGASGLGSPLLGRGLEVLLTSAWLLPAELARSSQEHLQRSVKYGGRQRLPYPGEMKAFLVLGVLPWSAELGLLSTGGLTLPYAWQNGKVSYLLLIHLPGGVHYKTKIQTFTVSTAP